MAAGLILVFFWIGLLAGLRDKGLAYDEIVHAAAGYSYWKFDDYRLNPENGNLPQRLMALPLVLSRYAFPSVQSEPWRKSEEWVLADRWFHRSGHDAAEMLRRGRAAAALFAVALGALVWFCARRLFGPAGGMLALGAFVLNPTVLANGGLMTSDMAAALFFLASPLCLWAALQRLSLGRVALSGLAMGALFLSKMSAPLILPIFLVLAAVRLLDGRPWPARFGLNRELARRGGKAVALVALAAAHLVIVFAMAWAFYGFRFSAFAPAVSGPPGTDQLALPWNEVLQQATPDIPPAAPAARVFSFARGHRLLPEAFVYGYAYSWRFSHERGAFLNGEYSVRGWRRFFPYTFLVKTPLAWLAILVLAVAAAWARWWRGSRALAQIRSSVYATLPLRALLVCYWTAAIFSHVDIGHRHILPIYAPLFVLCGSAALWPVGARRWRIHPAHAALAVLVVVLGLETAWRFPNYLGYFNGLVAPADGYRHLVDSSSDWGQELPALKRYIAGHPSASPRYLSYFGSGSPAYEGIPAELTNGVMPVQDPSTQPLYVEGFPRDGFKPGLPDFLTKHPEFDAVGAVRQAGGGDINVIFLRKASALQLHEGTYFISGTLLESVKFESSRPWESPWGPWNSRYERVYQQLRQGAQPFLSGDPSARAAVIARSSPTELWVLLLRVLQYDEYRFARLKAYLRHRQPDDAINFSILVYRLTEADLARALDGPPPELGPDVAAGDGSSR